MIQSDEGIGLHNRAWNIADPRHCRQKELFNLISKKEHGNRSLIDCQMELSILSCRKCSVGEAETLASPIINGINGVPMSNHILGLPLEFLRAKAVVLDTNIFGVPIEDLFGDIDILGRIC